MVLSLGGVRGHASPLECRRSRLGGAGPLDPGFVPLPALGAVRAYDREMTSPGDPSSSSWPGTGALELEDLLAELRARAFVARRSQERMSDLLDAVVAVSSELDLAEVLSRIVQSASSLVDSRYGALGVLSADGEHLVEFITRGLSAQERAVIGEPPRGHGVLGLLIRDPHPRRLRDISQHPDSFGFPPNHPPMKSFLGAPIRIRDQVFGNLYMSEKLGADEFTPDDQAVLVALAAAASVAIDNARLYDASSRQGAWSEAVGEVTQVLLEHEDEGAALRLMVEQTCTLSRGTHAFVALYDAEDKLVVRQGVRLADGVLADPPMDGWSAPLSGPHWRRVRAGHQPLLLSGDPAPTDDLDDGDRQSLTADVSRVTGASPHGHLGLVPLPPRHGDLGVLILTWEASVEGLQSEQMVRLSDYAQQAGLALLAGRARRDRARMALFDDRDRIARDMHDHVIQRLFATGLSLQSTSRAAMHPMVQTRLDEAVDEIDAAIKEIRHAIFELHQPAMDQTPQEELDALVTTFTQGLGFSPSLLVEGRYGDVDAPLRSDLLAVVREGLSNIARHAEATRADVRVVIGPDLQVEISDDGRGMGAREARSGLINLRDRAKAMSGVFEVHSVEPRGTLLRWQVPWSAE